MHIKTLKVDLLLIFEQLKATDPKTGLILSRLKQVADAHSIVRGATRDSAINVTALEAVADGVRAAICCLEQGRIPGARICIGNSLALLSEYREREEVRVN